MEVFKAIKGRRSVRKFKPDPVKTKDPKRILDAGRWRHPLTTRSLGVRDCRGSRHKAAAGAGSVSGRGNVCVNVVSYLKALWARGARL
jgi:nitroreductase